MLDPGNHLVRQGKRCMIGEIMIRVEVVFSDK